MALTRANAPQVMGAVLASALALAGATAYRHASNSRSAQASRAGSVLATIPFEIVVGHIFLKVTVKSSGPLWFILDTGSPIAILDMARAKQLGLKPRGSVDVDGAGEASQKGALIQGCPYAIPGLAGFSGSVTLAVPLDILRPRLGHEVDGILGADFINRFVVEVDYLSRTITLYGPEEYRYSGSGESIPFTFNQAGHPVVKTELVQPGRPPIPGDFVVDMGSGAALILNERFVEREHILAPGQPAVRMMLGGGIGGPVGGLVGRVSALKIGTLVVDRPETLFSTDEKGVLASTALFQGNIGFRILRKFKVILDYSNMRIILEPNSRFKEPMEFVSGFTVVSDAVNYTLFHVDYVASGSPAAEAGIQPGDVIAAVDGKPASDLTLTAIDEVLAKSGLHELKIRRGLETLRVKVNLRPLI